MLAALLALVAAGAAESPEARAAVRLCLSLEAPAEESLLGCRQAAALGLPAPGAVPIRAFLARRLAALGRWDEVIEIYSRLAAERPREAEWRVRLGAALLFGAGKPPEAEAALREALRRDGASADAWALLGCALAAQRKYAEAVTALERAQSLDAGSLQARPALAEILAAARRGESWP